MYQRAYELVQLAFKDKKDKADIPYIIHLLGVSSKGLNEYEETLGLLHDILEDTPITKEELLKLQFPLDLIERIELLTHHKNESYDIYINRLINSNDEIALRVKKYDLLNNLDVSRLNKLTPDKITYFNNKYIPVLIKINNKLKELQSKSLNK